MSSITNIAPTEVAPQIVGSPSSLQTSDVPKPQKPRRRLGRAARRRRNKVREIRQSVQNLLNTTKRPAHGDADIRQEHEVHITVEDESTSCLPTDRNRSLPGVLIKRRQLNSQHSNINKTNNKKQSDDLQLDGFSSKDGEMLTSQLGFIPGNGLSVASRVNDIKDLYPNLFKLLSQQPLLSNDNNYLHQSKGYPMVLQLYPLVIRDVHHGGKSGGKKFKSRKRGHTQTLAEENETKDASSVLSQTEAQSKTTMEPFPTMYWLTHPYLRTLISQIEIEPTHNVKAMEQKLLSHPDYLESMHNAHVSYGTQRWNLLTDEERIYAEERKWIDALASGRGVAGIRNFETIKCLHAHAAHYLAQLAGSKDENININCIGRWTLEAVEELIVKGGEIPDDEIDDKEEE